MPSQFDGLKIKSRVTESGQFKWNTRVQAGTSNPTSTDNVVVPGDGSQVTLTIGHPWPPSDRSQEDVGGPFKTSRTYFTDRIGGKPLMVEDFPRRIAMSPGWGQFDAPGNWSLGYRFDLPILPTLPPDFPSNYWAQIGPDPASSESALLARGATAISRCKPTNSIANLSVALAELWREGLPHAPGISAWKDRTNAARAASSEYLNTMFGWLPLVNDIKGVASAMAQQDQIWRQYQRDAGRVVRRRYSFPTEKTTTVLSKSSNQYPYQLSNPYVAASWGELTVTKTTVRNQWFSGAFTYYLPKATGSGPLDSWIKAVTKARAVYGLTLDPEVVWNLTPWSWAADWVANTGDVLSNVSDFITDGLVMRYGYVMESVAEYIEYSLVGYRPHKGTLNHDPKLVMCRETKQRLRASPYGFGLTWDSFSPRQLAILAALGIQKVT